MKMLLQPHCTAVLGEELSICGNFSSYSGAGRVRTNVHRMRRKAKKIPAQKIWLLSPLSTHNLRLFLYLYFHQFHL